MDKEEKIKILEHVIKRLEGGYCWGICTALNFVCLYTIQKSVTTFDEVAKMFPEITNNMPEGAEKNKFWWDPHDKKVRIEFLNKRIEELKQQ